jgi:hypothetical protein
LVEDLYSSGPSLKNIKIKIYKTIILPVGVYWYGTWLVLLKGERRLMVFQNGVMRIFGPKG